MSDSVAMPAVRQNCSKLAATFSQATSRPDATSPADVLFLFIGVAFPRGFDTPSLRAQGGQRLPSYFNRLRDIPSDPSPAETLRALTAEREARSRSNL